MMPRVIHSSETGCHLRHLRFLLLAAVAGLSAIQVDAGGQRAASSTVTLSIVGTNDLHGGILPDNGQGGLALFAGYVKNLRAARTREGGAVLLVDAGDMWQGTLESNLREGAPVVAAYNALGYTAAAVGNHEFDFGPVGPDATPATSTVDARGALKARASEASFPFLAATWRKPPPDVPWRGRTCGRPSWSRPPASKWASSA